MEDKQGALFMALAYILWGIFPLYWKLLDVVQSEEILTHRIIWSFAFMILFLMVKRELKELCQQLIQLTKELKLFFYLFLSSLFISLNWFIYIWAVNHERVLETSLGYYINPIVSVFLGKIFLQEKMNRGQQFAFVLAGIGVFISTVEYGQIPWVSLLLALTFGFYGLAKKVTKLKASFSLTLETLIVLPIAMIYLTYIGLIGESAFFLFDGNVNILLIGGGILTAIPLLLFAYGATKIPLYMIGVLQYIAPTLSFVIGVFLFHEPFSTVDFITFTLIWCGIIVFTISQPSVQTKLKWKKTQTMDV